jgi:acetyl esterase/lipase
VCEGRRAPARATPSSAAPNTGAADSPCRAAVLPGDADPALDMTSLGSSARAAYEIGRPVGSVRRVMLLVHGGGWYKVGQGALNPYHDNARAWRNAGWETVNVDYGACGHSLPDVVKTYDLVRAQVGDAVPICVQGDSAGGQLALMLAVRRSAVACVIAYGAPTDLWTGSAYALGMARAAFGRERLTKYSPASGAARISARVLLATATDDSVIPQSQNRELADRMIAAQPGASVDVATIDPGPLSFVHGSASPFALADLQARVQRLVAPFGSAPRALPILPFVPWRMRG